MTTVLFTEKSIERLQKIVSSATMLTGASYVSSLLLTTSRIPRTINDGIHTITFQAMLGTCKCTPKGKETQYVNGVIRTIGRQEVKVGRMVRSVLIEEMGYELTDAQIEDFVNTMRVTLVEGDAGAEYEFVMVKGNDIRKYYRYYYYAGGQHEGNGTLWNSCMRSGDDEWFNIYADNPNCEMLLQVMPSKKDGNYQVLSRAIVWKTTDGITLMDRVYTVKDEYFAAMRNYAMEKGWHYKHRNSSDSERDIVTPNGEVSRIKVSVDTGLKDLSRFPYMDTMKYYEQSTGILANHAMSERPYMLQETCGGYSSCACHVMCEISKEWVYPDHVQTLGHLSRMPGAKVSAQYAHYALCGYNIDGSRYHQYLLEDEVETSSVGSVTFAKGILNEQGMQPILNLKIDGRDGYYSLFDFYGHSYSGVEKGMKRYSVCWSSDEVRRIGLEELPEAIKKCIGEEHLMSMIVNKSARKIIQMLIPALQASGVPIFDGRGNRVQQIVNTATEVAEVQLKCDRPTKRRSTLLDSFDHDEVPF